MTNKDNEKFLLCEDLFVLSSNYRGIYDNYLIKAEADKLWEETKDLKKVDSFCEKMLLKQESILLLKKSNINKRFINKKFDNFKTFDKITKSAKEIAEEYAENIYAHLAFGTNLVIEGLGKVGTGKTHLACAIAHKAIEQGVQTKFINVVSMISDLKERMNIPKYIRTYTDTSLLIIDDIGKEKNSEWVCQTVYQIINIRYEKQKPTIITTENSIKTMTSHYKEKGKAIQSRILENHILITLDGKDYRQNKDKIETN